jgi:aryl-alcohol dehydrogenase-like predicted oxidoreductase
MYGDGATEEFVGDALRGIREQVFLVSNVYPYNAGGKKAAERGLKQFEGPQDRPA